MVAELPLGVADTEEIKGGVVSTAAKLDAGFPVAGETPALPQASEELTR
jgi:hypothetical protein